MADNFMNFLKRDLTCDDIVGIVDELHGNGLLSHNVVGRMKRCNDLSSMLALFLHLIWSHAHDDIINRALDWIATDYNFIAIRIKKEVAEFRAVRLSLISRPKDPLNCHPMHLNVPSTPNEYWDHTVTFVYVAANQLHYDVIGDGTDVEDEYGAIVVPDGSQTCLCREKCREENTDGTDPQISLWLRFKGFPTRTKQTVKFTLRATSFTDRKIECTSVCVDFHVKRRKQKPDTKQSLVSRASQSPDSQMTLCRPVQKSTPFIFEAQFNEKCWLGMQSKLSGQFQLNNTEEFLRVAKGLRKYFDRYLQHSDMTIAVRILEGNQAYLTGDPEKCYRQVMKGKQLVSRSQNHNVSVSNCNMQLAVSVRRLKKFALALKLIQEAHQVMQTIETCHTHGLLYKCEAVIYSLMLQQSPHPNRPLKQLAVEKFEKALDILKHARPFYSSRADFTVRGCYLQLAELLLDVPSTDMRPWRKVTDEEMRRAESCLQAADNMYIGRGSSKLCLITAKLLIRKREFLEAERMLLEGKRSAEESGALIDGEFCDELLQVVRGSQEYALETIRRLSITEGKAIPANCPDSNDADADADDAADDDEDYDFDSDADADAAASNVDAASNAAAADDDFDVAAYVADDVAAFVAAAASATSEYEADIDTATADDDEREEESEVVENLAKIK